MGKNNRVLVALSGGIDSAMSALLLLEEGMEVEAVTFLFWNKSLERIAGNPETYAKNASLIAESLGIPHYIRDVSEEFKRNVIDYLTKSYLSGTTPNPCAMCNQEVKFRYLLEEADSGGFHFVSTGHYARIEDADQGRRLLRGMDDRRDQSYFLSLLHPDRLSRMIFPLGIHYKEEMIRMAEKRSLPIPESESREICFLGKGDYRRYLKRFLGDRTEKGEIVDVSGEVLGVHDGFWNYTVGQRRSIGIPAARPYYVVETDAKENKVVVGFREHVLKREVVAGQFNWISGRQDKKELQVTGMIRYNQRPAPGTAYVESTDSIRMVFDEPRFAPAPGQVMALYDGEQVIGGGIIQ